MELVHKKTPFYDKSSPTFCLYYFGENTLLLDHLIITLQAIKYLKIYTNQFLNDENIQKILRHFLQETNFYLGLEE